MIYQWFPPTAHLQLLQCSTRDQGAGLAPGIYREDGENDGFLTRQNKDLTWFNKEKWWFNSALNRFNVI
jgi:hypothetical protein